MDYWLPATDNGKFALNGDGVNQVSDQVAETRCPLCKNRIPANANIKIVAQQTREFGFQLKN